MGTLLETARGNRLTLRPDAKIREAIEKGGRIRLGLLPLHVHLRESRAGDGPSPSASG